MADGTRAAAVTWRGLLWNYTACPSKGGVPRHRLTSEDVQLALPGYFHSLTREEAAMQTQFYSPECITKELSKVWSERHFHPVKYQMTSYTSYSTAGITV